MRITTARRAPNKKGGILENLGLKNSPELSALVGMCGRAVLTALAALAALAALTVVMVAQEAEAAAR